ncbi:hypothetical protein IFM89_033253 [Coptis chinensis]|uniref:Protein FAR1-RELATED SEQUENCE n=1 Tax=Coptis chinensis TaxID=261450 RepID=A0A835IZ70_9MAGN|nr:hypothetical protein IFM89_033253 [Coptis chinensis]
MAVSNVKNEWVVIEVVHEHNHELATPSKTYLLRSQRRVKEPQGAEISSLDAAGIASIDGYKYMTHQAGKLENSRRQAEIEADFNSSQMSQRLFVSTPMLKQASDMYTHAVFEIFEVEYKEHLMYNIKECSVDGTTYTYEVTREGSVRGRN